MPIKNLLKYISSPLCMFLIGGFLNSNCRTIDEKLKDNDVAGHYHTVKIGDTLAALSKQYRLPVAEIMDINGIDDEHSLRVGRALFMPDPDPIRKKIATLKPKTTPNNKKSVEPIKIIEKMPIFDFPVTGGSIVYNFSKTKSKPYDGIGIKAPLGTKIIAPDEGRVLFVGNDGTKFGLLIILEHKNSFITVYAHLQESKVKIGQKISRGAWLGTVGTSGGVDFPHLHFQVRVDERPQDPRLYLHESKAH